MYISRYYWSRLEELLRQEGALRANRLCAEKFTERHQAGMASVLRDADGQIVACAFLWETGQAGLVELGTVWVHPRYRYNAPDRQVLSFLNGKAPSEAVFEECCAIANNRGLRAIMLTCKKRVADLARQAEWTEDNEGVRSILNQINHTPDDSFADKYSPASPGDIKRRFRSW